MASQTPNSASSSGASAPSVVNTIQAVRSPIWSLPMLSEGQLNVGVQGNTSIVTTPELPPVGQMVTVSVGGESSSPVIPLENASTHQPGGVAVATGQAVHAAALAKSLTPRQMGSAVTNLVPAHQTPSPLQANLSQLASQLPKLTPEMILASMKQLQQQQQAVAQQQQQQSLMQALAGSGGGMATPTMVGSGRVTRGNRTKVLAPRHHQIHQQPQPMGVGGQVVLPGSTPLMMQAAPQKIVAPLAAVPPTSTPAGPSHHSLLYGVDSTTSSTQTGPRPTITTNKPRKPCNCKNSQCLKLYCDCFANGEFCREFCNCQNCKNNVEHAEERAKAVKTCLDRNPHAFKPKVGQNKSGDERRHIKGCNCKRSGCLKNYCECYEAKIPCSSNCRCIGCKNLPEKMENKSLMQLADAADIRTQQQRAATSHFMEQLEMSSVKPQPRTQDGHRLPFSFINKDVARATCLCLLEEASHSMMNGKSSVEAEKAVMEEFGRCLTQIINSAQSANDDVDRSMVVH